MKVYVVQVVIFDYLKFFQLRGVVCWWMISFGEDGVIECILQEEFVIVDYQLVVFGGELLEINVYCFVFVIGQCCGQFVKSGCEFIL